MRATITRAVTSWITSAAARDVRRSVFALRRRASGQQPTVHYFHQVDDPYSHLTAQVLADFAARYRVVLAPHLTSPPEDANAPQRARLADYALRDAARVARRYGLAFPDGAVAPTAAMRAGALAALAGVLESQRFADAAPKIGWALWSGRAVPTAPRAGEAEVTRLLREGDDLRRTLGHYLGAMFQFEGEWYWGVDRLHHLERRLAAMGLDSRAGEPMIAPYQRESVPVAAQAPGAKIDYWFSFRSPYSYIALPRIARLARDSGAELRLRFILPMVMRGLPVPPAKRLYIVRDCKREADMVNLPFGRIVDPVGVGVERALAVLHAAIPRGKGVAFAEAALRAAFADGVDLAADKGLFAVAGGVGIAEADVRAALADESWRAVAEDNRAALFAAGSVARRRSASTAARRTGARIACGRSRKTRAYSRAQKHESSADALEGMNI